MVISLSPVNAPVTDEGHFRLWKHISVASNKSRIAPDVLQMINIEPVKAIDGGDGAWSWHRNVPRWVLSHEPMKEIITVRFDPLTGRPRRINRREVGRGRKKGAPRPGLGRSRGGFTTKIHLDVNGASQPVRSDITAGKTSDYPG